MDGSSKFFIDALQEAEIEELNTHRKEYIIKDTITFKDEEYGSEITVIPSDTYQVTAMVDYETKVLGTQNATLSKLSLLSNSIRSLSLLNIFPFTPLLKL